MDMQRILTVAVEWIQHDPGLALLIAAVAYLGLMLIVLVLLFRVVMMGRKQARLLRGTDGASLERMLLEQLDGAREVREQITQATRVGDENAISLQLCLQKVGLVRYDAFSDVGGEQSFSLALLDGGNNGLVVSGLFSRNDMRVYAKPVVAGGSPLALTDEEQKAIAGAHAGGPVTQQGGRSGTRNLMGGRR